MTIMDLPIYLDYQATTPMDPRVLDAMLPFFKGSFGNPSSGTHRFGWEADAAVKAARARCAEAIGAEPREIVFTSGSTESINLALKGTAATAGDRDHLIVGSVEHPAVLDVAEFLERRGAVVTRLPVDSFGMIDLDGLAAAITEKTWMVALMAANNEIGTRNDLGAIGALCREKGALFFCDATQGVGKLPLDVKTDPIDLLSFTAHKMYGPKGVGVLYVRSANPHVRLEKQLHGGGQERAMRSGTLNVPGIVGLGKAVALSMEERDAEAVRLSGFRNRLLATIQGKLTHVHLNGHPEFRLPGNLSLSFDYVDGEALIMDLRDLAISAGSACSSGSSKASHVLTGIGLDPRLAGATLRIGLGRFTTEEQVDYAADQIVAAVKRLRDLSPLYELAKDRDLV